MTKATFPYVQQNPAFGIAGYMPCMPIELQFGSNFAAVYGLVDSGSAVSVLPYGIGLQLGAQWNQLPIAPPLGGSLSASPARGVFMKAVIPPFPPQILYFAWSRDPNVPLLLGQSDFFMFYDVCFHRSQLFFEVQPKP